MNNELAKQLKDAGYPIKYQQPHSYEWVWGTSCTFIAVCNLCGYKNSVYNKIGPGSDITCEIDGCPQAKEIFVYPTLAELIEACGIKMNRLTQNEMNNDSILWTAVNFEGSILGEGSTPEEAVSKLWLVLHEKND